MKKWIFICLLCCLVTVLLAACSTGGEGVAGDTSPSVADATEDRAAELLQQAEGPVPDFLDPEQQVLYRRAKTAFMEFALDNTGFGSNGGGEPDLEQNDMTYWRCTGSITAWADFEAAMLAVFTPDYFTELNASASYTDGNGDYHERTIFAEQEGDLYYSGGARGGNVTFMGPETFELISSGENEIRFYVVGTYDDFATDEKGELLRDEVGDYLRAGSPETEKQELVMVNTPDGWRFSEFKLAF